MIKNGKVVNLAYCLKNSDGDVLDQADANDPFTYLHGTQQIVPGLENALEGLKTGDKKQVTVQPAEGYGEVNQDLKLVVNRSQFPSEAKLQPGMQFETHTPDGMGIVFTIDAVEGDKVHIDGNHPLAGQTLHFDVEVLGVRDATEEELKEADGGCCGGHCGGDCCEDCGDGCGDDGHNHHEN